MLVLEKETDGAAGEGLVVAKAVTRAAGLLDVSAQALAEIIGLSPASVSRLKAGNLALSRGSKPFELALLFIRLYRSLDAITGGDAPVARQWLKGPNSVLGGRPADLIKTISGLTDVLAYLDARRALV